MAITRSERLVEFLASVDGGGSERVVGMQVRYMIRFTDDVAGTIEEKNGIPVNVDWPGLVALIHPDDQDILHGLLAAAIAARP